MIIQKELSCEDCVWHSRRKCVRCNRVKFYNKLLKRYNDYERLDKERLGIDCDKYKKRT